MSEKVSEVEENTLRVLLSTMRKHDPDALQQIIFDVLLFGLKDTDVHIMLQAKGSDVSGGYEAPTDDPIVESVVIAIRGSENSAKFFKALEAADLDEAEDTEIQ